MFLLQGLFLRLKRPTVPFDVFKFLFNIKKTLIISSVIFVIGIGVGVWITNKFYAISKINMLESYIDKQKISHNKTVKNLEAVHQVKIKIAEDKVQIKEVTKYVKDNRVCDLSVAAVKLLNGSRTGMPNASAITDEEASTASPITQTEQIKQCSEDGIAFRNLLVDHNGLIDFVNDNWKE